MLRLWRRDYEDQMSETPAKYNNREVYWTFYDEIDALPRIDRDTVRDLNAKNIRALRDYEEALHNISTLENEIAVARRIMREAVAARAGYVDIATRLGYDVELLKHTVHSSDAYRAYMTEEVDEQ